VSAAEPLAGRDGGNYAMIIHAVGPYDSDDSDANDADRVLTQFTRLLEDAGHQIRSVTLVTGSRVRNAVRDRSGGYVLADAPASLPEPGLDPAVTDPIAVQASHDEAVRVHNEVAREREAAEAAAEQDAVTRHRETAAARAGQDEAVREHFAGIREQDKTAREHDDGELTAGRYATGGVVPGQGTDEASRQTVADAASAAIPGSPVIP
jgi:hypothetical protein